MGRVRRRLLIVDGYNVMNAWKGAMKGKDGEAIADALSDTQTTVGTALNIEHISATPVGVEVHAEATVTAVDGKVITFEVKAFDALKSS